MLINADYYNWKAISLFKFISNKTIDSINIDYKLSILIFVIGIKFLFPRNKNIRKLNLKIKILSIVKTIEMNLLWISTYSNVNKFNELFLNLIIPILPTNKAITKHIW